MEEATPLVGRAVDGARRLHRRRDGAIAMLALVGAIIIFMLALAMFDAQDVARQKAQTQAAADTAAFSQAAIKARGMNMLAYTNVAKRSIWGIHSTYPAYLDTMHWWVQFVINNSCSACQSASSESQVCELCRLGRSERDKWINAVCRESEGHQCEKGSPETWGLFHRMSQRDYSDEMEMNDDGTEVSGRFPRVILGDFGPKTGSGVDETLFEKYYGQDVRALDNYQRYIFGITPWWGWSEQLVKGLRNGASVTVGWPMPAGRFPGGLFNRAGELADQVNETASLGGRQSSSTNITDALPAHPGEAAAMRKHIRGQLEESSLVDCIRSQIDGSGSCGDDIDPFYLEHIANGLLMYLKSEGVVGGNWSVPGGGGGALSSLAGGVSTLFAHLCSLDAKADDFLCDTLTGWSLGGFDRGLEFTEESFERIFDGSDRDDAITGGPWFVRPAENEAKWRRQMSNIVVAYKTDFKKFDDERARRKYHIIKQRNYRRNWSESAASLRRGSYLYSSPGVPLAGPELAVQKALYSASGYWGLARSEIYFSGDRTPDLWHPSWSARLRPLVLSDDEFDKGGYSMNQVYHDTMMGFALAGGLGMSETSDFDRAMSDLLLMEKATRSMGDSTIGAVAK